MNIILNVVSSKTYKFITIGVAIAAITSAAFVLLTPRDHITKEMWGQLEKEWVKKPEDYFTPHLKDRITNLENKFDETQKLLMTAEPGDMQLMSEVTDIKTKLEDVSKRMSSLELALLNTPSKALSVPLLEKDLQMMKMLVQREQKEIDRLYSHIYWITPLVLAIALASLPLAISNKKDHGKK